MIASDLIGFLSGRKEKDGSLDVELLRQMVELEFDEEYLGKNPLRTKAFGALCAVLDRKDAKLSDLQRVMANSRMTVIIPVMREFLSKEEAVNRTLLWASLNLPPRMEGGGDRDTRITRSNIANSAKIGSMVHLAISDFDRKLLLGRLRDMLASAQIQTRSRQEDHTVISEVVQTVRTLFRLNTDFSPVPEGEVSTVFEDHTSEAGDLVDGLKSSLEAENLLTALNCAQCLLELGLYDDTEITDGAGRLLERVKQGPQDIGGRGPARVNPTIVETAGTVEALLQKAPDAEEDTPRGTTPPADTDSDADSTGPPKRRSPSGKQGEDTPVADGADRDEELTRIVKTARMTALYRSSGFSFSARKMPNERKNAFRIIANKDGEPAAYIDVYGNSIEKGFAQVEDGFEDFVDPIKRHALTAKRNYSRRYLGLEEALIGLAMLVSRTAYGYEDFQIDDPQTAKICRTAGIKATEHHYGKLTVDLEDLSDARRVARTAIKLDMLTLGLDSLFKMSPLMLISIVFLCTGNIKVSFIFFLLGEVLVAAFRKYLYSEDESSKVINAIHKYFVIIAITIVFAIMLVDMKRAHRKAHDFQHERAANAREIIENGVDEEEARFKAEFLVAALRDDIVPINVEAVEDIMRALVIIGDPAVEPLLEALNDEKPYTRRYVILTLQGIGDVRAVGPLADVLEYDKDKSVRIRAAEALGGILKHEEGRVIGEEVMGAGVEALASTIIYPRNTEYHGLVVKAAKAALFKIGPAAIGKLEEISGTCEKDYQKARVNAVIEKIREEAGRVEPKKARRSPSGAERSTQYGAERHLAKIREIARRVKVVCIDWDDTITDNITEMPSREFWALMETGAEKMLNPGIKDLLQVLHAEGIPIYLLSNGDGDRISRCAREAGIADYFKNYDGDSFSDIGFMLLKDYRIKEIAVELAIDTSEVAMIGDNFMLDIVPASDAGAAAIGFTKDIRLEDLLTEYGADAVIYRDFTQAARIFREELSRRPADERSRPGLRRRSPSGKTFIRLSSGNSLDDIQSHISVSCRRGDHNELYLDWDQRYLDYQEFIKRAAAVNGVIRELGSDMDFCADNPEFVKRAIEIRCGMMEDSMAPLTPAGREFIERARRTKGKKALEILNDIIAPLTDSAGRGVELWQEWFIPLLGGSRLRSFKELTWKTNVRLSSVWGCSQQCDHCWLSSSFCVHVFPWGWALGLKERGFNLHLTSSYSSNFKDYYDLIFDMDGFHMTELFDNLEGAFNTPPIEPGSVAARGAARAFRDCGHGPLIAISDTVSVRRRFLGIQQYGEALGFTTGFDSPDYTALLYRMRRVDDPHEDTAGFYPEKVEFEDGLSYIVGRAYGLAVYAGVSFTEGGVSQRDGADIENEHKGETLLLPDGSVRMMDGFDDRMRVRYAKIFPSRAGTGKLCLTCPVSCSVRKEGLLSLGLSETGGIRRSPSGKTARKTSANIPALLELVQSGDDMERRTALYEISQLKKAQLRKTEVAETLRAALDDEDPLVRYAALHALSKCSDDVFAEAVLKGLDDEDKMICHLAVRKAKYAYSVKYAEAILDKLLGLSVNAVPIIMGFEGIESEAREAIVGNLGYLGKEATPVLKGLLGKHEHTKFGEYIKDAIRMARRGRQDRPEYVRPSKKRLIDGLVRERIGIKASPYKKGAEDAISNVETALSVLRKEYKDAIVGVCLYGGLEKGHLDPGYDGERSDIDYLLIVSNKFERVEDDIKNRFEHLIGMRGESPCVMENSVTTPSYLSDVRGESWPLLLMYFFHGFTIGDEEELNKIRFAAARKANDKGWDYLRGGVIKEKLEEPKYDRLGLDTIYEIEEVIDGRVILHTPPSRAHVLREQRAVKAKQTVKTKSATRSPRSAKARKRKSPSGISQDVPALLERACSEDDMEKREAIHEISCLETEELNRPEVEAALLEAMDDEDFLVRYAALYTLSKCEGEALAEGVMKGLDDESSMVKYLAVRKAKDVYSLKHSESIFRKIFDLPYRAIPRILGHIGGIGSPDSDAIMDIAKNLGSLGEEAIPALSRIQQDFGTTGYSSSIEYGLHLARQGGRARKVREMPADRIKIIDRISSRRLIYDTMPDGEKYKEAIANVGRALEKLQADYDGVIGVCISGGMEKGHFSPVKGPDRRSDIDYSLLLETESGDKSNEINGRFGMYLVAEGERPCVAHSWIYTTKMLISSDSKSPSVCTHDLFTDIFLGDVDKLRDLRLQVLENMSDEGWDKVRERLMYDKMEEPKVNRWGLNFEEGLEVIDKRIILYMHPSRIEVQRRLRRSPNGGDGKDSPDGEAPGADDPADEFRGDLNIMDRLIKYLRHSRGIIRNMFGKSAVLPEKPYEMMEVLLKHFQFHQSGEDAEEVDWFDIQEVLKELREEGKLGDMDTDHFRRDPIPVFAILPATFLLGAVFYWLLPGELATALAMLSVVIGLYAHTMLFQKRLRVFLIQVPDDKHGLRFRDEVFNVEGGIKTVNYRRPNGQWVIVTSRENWEADRKMAIWHSVLESHYRHQYHPTHWVEAHNFACERQAQYYRHEARRLNDAGRIEETKEMLKKSKERLEARLPIAEYVNLLGVETSVDFQYVVGHEDITAPTEEYQQLIGADFDIGRSGGTQNKRRSPSGDNAAGGDVEKAKQAYLDLRSLSKAIVIRDPQRALLTLIASELDASKEFYFRECLSHSLKSICDGIMRSEDQIVFQVAHGLLITARLLSNIADGLEKTGVFLAVKESLLHDVENNRLIAEIANSAISSSKNKPNQFAAEHISDIREIRRQLMDIYNIVRSIDDGNEVFSKLLLEEQGPPEGPDRGKRRSPSGVLVAVEEPTSATGILEDIGADIEVVGKEEPVQAFEKATESRSPSVSVLLEGPVTIEMIDEALEPIVKRAGLDSERLKAILMHVYGKLPEMEKVDLNELIAHWRRMAKEIDPSFKYKYTSDIAKLKGEEDTIKAASMVTLGVLEQGLDWASRIEARRASMDVSAKTDPIAEYILVKTREEEARARKYLYITGLIDYIPEENIILARSTAEAVSIAREKGLPEDAIVGIRTLDTETITKNETRSVLLKLSPIEEGDEKVYVNAKMYEVLIDILAAIADEKQPPEIDGLKRKSERVYIYVPDAAPQNYQDQVDRYRKAVEMMLSAA
ncbi:HEAT repeat domain-containing protein [Candidatus Omnitrophota bacterium]